MSHPSFSRREILQNILSSTQSHPKRPTKSTSASESILPPIPSSSLSAPEDITSSLISHGLEFKAARAVSSAYLDNAVQLQLHSQSRLQTNQQTVSSARSRLSSRFSAPTDISKLQTKLRKVHDKVYRKDLKTMLKKTISLAKSRLQAAQTSQQRMDESEDDPADASDGEDAAGAEGPANADDEKALQEMSARSSVLLSLIYERGHTFPKRYEKIKLAEETGLTYRQIGIWFSNRRERNRPGRERGVNRGGSIPSSAPSSKPGTSRRAATATVRESTAESTTENGHSPSSAVTASSLVAAQSQEIMEEEPECAPTPTDDTDLWGEGTYVANSGDEALGRVPSMSNSVATLESLRSTSSSFSVTEGPSDQSMFASLLNANVAIQQPTPEMSASSALTFDFGSLGSLSGVNGVSDFPYLPGIDPNVTAIASSTHPLPASMPATHLPTLDTSGYNAHDLLTLLPTAPPSSATQTPSTTNLNLSFAPAASFSFLADGSSTPSTSNADQSLAFFSSIILPTEPQQSWSTMNEIQAPLAAPTQSHPWQQMHHSASFNGAQFPYASLSAELPPAIQTSRPIPQATHASSSSSSRPLAATRSMPILPAGRPLGRSSRSPPAGSRGAAGNSSRKTPIAIAPGPAGPQSGSSNAAANAIAKRPIKPVPVPRSAGKAQGQPRPIMAAPSQLAPGTHLMRPTPSNALKRTASEALGEGISAAERRPLRC